MHHGNALGVGFLLFLASLPAATASAADDVYVPEALKPWQDWVLEGKEYLDCPFFFDQQQNGPDSFICAWPGELELNVTADGGRFTEVWTVYASEQWLPLPGDRGHWPEQVTANGESIEVVLRDTAPGVRLKPGRHGISGRFVWDERPQELRVPRETGLLELVVDGNRVTRPERNGDAVWLGERETQTQAEDRLGVTVYRLVADDVPTRLTTRFEIEVSGGVREVLLGPALPAGFLPMALESLLPVRLEPDGNLRLQLRPGRWQVELQARSNDELNTITLAAPETNLPDSEIWSYRSNDRLRVTAPEGLPPVDPEQVSVPPGWQEFPAFRIAPGESLSIVERSRGKVARDNQLRLERRLWLDFDGGGFVFSDSIGGTMRSTWRLDMAPPYALLSASEGGSDLLVTLGAAEGLTGVELRRSDIDLKAVGRSETRGAMPVSGWQTRLDGVTTVLNLPPGHMLIAATGADSAAGAWIERWELLDFFLVLIVIVATARLFGWQAGVIAFPALVLSCHESGAPQWIWLNLLAAIALVRAAPEGRLRTFAIFYRGIGFAALLVVLIPFLAGQLRIGIYPQLESQTSARPVIPGLPAGAGQEPALENVASDQQQKLRQAASSTAAVARMSFSYSRRNTYARYAPNAIVQAGPGRPSWSWNTYALRWSGPVDPEQMLDLTIMPRWLVSVLRFVEVLLLTAFAALFAAEIFNLRWRWPQKGSAIARTSLPSILIGTLLAAALLVATPPARADTPSPEILQQLEQRLLEPPPCTPRCAEIAEASVRIGPDAMTIELVVHALADVAVPLPGSPRGWRPERVEIDGAPAREVYRGADGLLWIRATEGRHQVDIQGPLPPVDSLEVPFPATPRAIEVQSDDWSVAGIRDRRLLGSLELTRLQEEGAGADAARWESNRFPAFLRIERSIVLDLDWRVHTTVFRVAPQAGALTLKVPLLDGASLLTGNLTQTDGEVLVSMSPSERTVEWDATLQRTSPLTLEAADDAPWKEVWRFGIGNIWHANFSGVPESESAGPAAGARVAEFYPRGGETLTLQAIRPAASGGTSLAFDEVTVLTDVGARSRNVDMTLEYRSTRGAQHVITLPDGADVMDVNIDGQPEPLRARDGELTVPILPGEHVIRIRWQRDAETALRLQTPPVDLGAAAGNITLGIDLPANRWILATNGPPLGPAVLYWPELLAMILFALVLGRIELTPLRTRHWLLLGLGFSTFSWPALTIVAIWLLAAGARRQWQPSDELSWWRFNAAQVVFAVITFAALIAIVVTVPAGLLGTPDMQIAGNGSYGNALRWFADRSASRLPGASVVSLPLWMYKALILAWALWLSFALLRWLPWVWRCFVSQGLWRSRQDNRPERTSGAPLA